MGDVDKFPKSVQATVIRHIQSGSKVEIETVQEDVIEEILTVRKKSPCTDVSNQHLPLKSAEDPQLPCDKEKEQVILIQETPELPDKRSSLSVASSQPQLPQEGAEAVEKIRESLNALDFSENTVIQHQREVSSGVARLICGHSAEDQCSGTAVRIPVAEFSFENGEDSDVTFDSVESSDDSFKNTDTSENTEKSAVSSEEVDVVVVSENTDVRDVSFGDVVSTNVASENIEASDVVFKDSEIADVSGDVDAGDVASENVESFAVVFKNLKVAGDFFRNIDISDIASDTTDVSAVASKNVDISDVAYKNIKVSDVSSKNVKVSDIAPRKSEVIDAASENTEASNVIFVNIKASEVAALETETPDVPNNVQVAAVASDNAEVCDAASEKSEASDVASGNVETSGVLKNIQIAARAYQNLKGYKLTLENIQKEVGTVTTGDQATASSVKWKSLLPSDSYSLVLKDDLTAQVPEGNRLPRNATKTVEKHWKVCWRDFGDGEVKQTCSHNDLEEQWLELLDGLNSKETVACDTGNTIESQWTNYISSLEEEEQLDKHCVKLRQTKFPFSSADGGENLQSRPTKAGDECEMATEVSNVSRSNTTLLDDVPGVCHEDMLSSKENVEKNPFSVSYADAVGKTHCRNEERSVRSHLESGEVQPLETAENQTGAVLESSCEETKLGATVASSEVFTETKARVNNLEGTEVAQSAVVVDTKQEREMMSADSVSELQAAGLGTVVRIVKDSEEMVDTEAGECAEGAGALEGTVLLVSSCALEERCFTHEADFAKVVVTGTLESRGRTEKVDDDGKEVKMVSSLSERADDLSTESLETCKYVSLFTVDDNCLQRSEVAIQDNRNSTQLENLNHSYTDETIQEEPCVDETDGQRLPDLIDLTDKATRQKPSVGETKTTDQVLSTSKFVDHLLAVKKVEDPHRTCAPTSVDHSTVKTCEIIEDSEMRSDVHGKLNELETGKQLLQGQEAVIDAVNAETAKYILETFEKALSHCSEELHRMDGDVGKRGKVEMPVTRGKSNAVEKGCQTESHETNDLMENTESVNRRMREGDEECISDWVQTVKKDDQLTAEDGGTSRQSLMKKEMNDTEEVCVPGTETPLELAREVLKFDSFEIRTRDIGAQTNMPDITRPEEGTIALLAGSDAHADSTVKMSNSVEELRVMNTKDVTDGGCTKKVFSGDGARVGTPVTHSTGPVDKTAHIDKASCTETVDHFSSTKTNGGFSVNVANSGTSSRNRTLNYFVLGNDVWGKCDSLEVNGFANPVDVGSQSPTQRQCSVVRVIPIRLESGQEIAAEASWMQKGRLQLGDDAGQCVMNRRYDLLLAAEHGDKQGTVQRAQRPSQGTIHRAQGPSEAYRYFLHQQLQHLEEAETTGSRVVSAPWRYSSWLNNLRRELTKREYEKYLVEAKWLERVLSRDRCRSEPLQSHIQPSATSLFEDVYRTCSEFRSSLECQLCGQRNGFDAREFCRLYRPASGVKRDKREGVTVGERENLGNGFGSPPGEPVLPETQSGQHTADRRHRYCSVCGSDVIFRGTSTSCGDLPNEEEGLKRRRAQSVPGDSHRVGYRKLDTNRSIVDRYLRSRNIAVAMTDLTLPTLSERDLLNPRGRYGSRISPLRELPFEKHINALLADLQSTIRSSSGNLQQTPLQGPGNPRLPASQNTYSNIGSSAPCADHNPHQQNGPTDLNLYSNTTHVNHTSSQDKLYKHEIREEVRTEERSSGPFPSGKNPVTNNLSELDSLLSDLDNARSSGLYSKVSAVNGARPTVDSLLEELNSVGHHTSETVEKRTMTATTSHNVHSAPPPTGRPTASSATRELDDLMASLSGFKKFSDTTLELEQKSRKDSSRHENTSSRYTSSSTRPHVHKNELTTEDSNAVTRPTSATPPPRPPLPSSNAVLAVPPPRPPAPSNIAVSAEDVAIPAVLPMPPTPSPPPPAPVTSTIYVTRREAVDDPYIRPPSGGPVKRNDAEYRWVTDEIKHEVREVIELPELNQDTYAKPQKPKTPSPPPSQLDSMLGSLTSHMTEQGITTRQKGCCCVCDKPIVGQVITALGKTWHPEHFTCAHCQQELGTKNFFEREGKPYCEPDYHNLFSPKCSYCSGPILDKCVTALNTTWHPDHFFCAQCGNTFGEEGFHEKDGKPYCREDYFNMFAPKCGGCNSPIMENYISALNAQWHPECFVCRDCRQPFNGGSFFDHEGLPYCETHYHAKRGSLCAGCHKPITGRCITAMFRKFHPEHFVCTFCLHQLNKGTFKEQNDKPYCHGCFDKLFG